jgi:hypothetical protein
MDGARARGAMGLGWRPVAFALTVAAVTGTSAGAAPGRSVTTYAPGWSVTLHLATSHVRAGRSVRATLTIDNETGRRVRVAGCAADFTYQVDLGDRKIPNSPVSGAVACWTTLHPGRNVFHRRVSAREEVCGGRDGPPCPAPLPTGIYHTIVSWPTSAPGGVPDPGVLTITVTD